MTVPSVDELDELLDDLSSKGTSPVIIVIDCPDEQFVYFGLAGECGFVSNSGDHPYYATVGDMEATGSTTFDFDGHPTEIANVHLIPLDVARKVIREYVLTGRRSHSVEWQEI